MRVLVEFQDKLRKRKQKHQKIPEHKEQRIDSKFRKKTEEEETDESGRHGGKAFSFSSRYPIQDENCRVCTQLEAEGETAGLYEDHYLPVAAGCPIFMAME